MGFFVPYKSFLGGPFFDCSIAAIIGAAISNIIIRNIGTFCIIFCFLFT